MKGALSICCAFALGLAGCQLRMKDDPVIPEDVDTDVEPGPSMAGQLPTSCRPTTTAELQALYEATEDSVHELITCGGIQMQVALSMKVMIFASNEDLVSSSARSDIRQVVEAVGMTVDNPFTQDAEGSWTMRAGGSDGSTFALTFFDPTTDALVTVDPFRLDSYVLGATATSSRTWAEMKANPGAKTTFTYHWTEKGPLGHLLADGGTLPNPFSLEFSLLELGGAALGITQIDYGPFESVQDMLVESKIHMVDNRAAANIAYDVTGVRDSVRSLVEGGSLSFEVDTMMSTDGTFELTGDTQGLAYVGRGSLAGELHYGVSGGASIRIVSDFGAGEAYPTPRWECR